ncbi:MAG: hypothetical protein KAW12_07865, partial [Candidatus Aminicenantes bacterium]|nr:hypothetical protein [Candidatus Aminicenantes bacterium]
GIHLSKGELSYFAVFFLATIAVAVFFLMAGAALGTIRNLLKSLSILILCWIILVHLWPDLLKDAFEKYSDNKLESRYSLESRKKKIHTDYEKSLFEIAKRFAKSPDILKKRISRYEQYWNVDFKKILDIETENMNKIAGINDRLYFWSIFNPVTFFRAVNTELSSRGYRQYIEFYKTCIEKHKNFVRFYIDNRIVKRNPQMVPFIEGEEQVFHAKPALPAYFVPGVIIFFGWIVAAYLLSLFGFKRMLRPTQKKKVDFEKVKLDIRAGNYISLQAGKPRYLADQIYAALTGKSHKSFNGKITLDGKKIESLQPVFYLPEPDKLPADLKVRQLEKLAGLPVTSKDLFKDLELKKQTELFLKMAAATDRNILLIPDFVFMQNYVTEQKEIAQKLKALKGKTVIEIITWQAKPDLPHDNFDFYAHLFYHKKEGYNEPSLVKRYDKENHGKR